MSNNQRPNAQRWSIPEQIVEDPMSGFSFQFEKIPSGEFWLRVYSDLLPFGNLYIPFDASGQYVGGSTSLIALCKPAWPTDPDTLGEETQ